MKTSTRKILDKSFSALALSSMAIMCAAAVAFLAPIIINGSGAVWFKATVEHFKFIALVQIVSQVTGESLSRAGDYFSFYGLGTWKIVITQ